MIILKSHRMQNVPHTLCANNFLIVSLVTSFQQARHTHQHKFPPITNLSLFRIFLNKFCPNFLAKIPDTLRIHVLKLPHVRKFSRKNDSLFPHKPNIGHIIFLLIITLNNLYCFCVILSLRHKRASIVIFLTMLFNVTIEAMKYHLLLEAADVQNDKGFYPQVDTVIH